MLQNRQIAQNSSCRQCFSRYSICGSDVKSPVVWLGQSAFQVVKEDADAYEHSLPSCCGVVSHLLQSGGMSPAKLPPERWSRSVFSLGARKRVAPSA